MSAAETKSHTGKIGNIEVEIVIGDMTEIKADAYVVPRFRTGNVGHIGNHIASSGAEPGIALHSAYVEACAETGNKYPPFGNVVVTPSWGGNSSYLFNAITIMSKNCGPMEMIHAAMYNCVKAAGQKSLKTIVAPMLGTGNDSLDAEQSANAIMSGINRLALKDDAPEKITLVVYRNEKAAEATYNKLVNALTKRTYENRELDRAFANIEAEAFHVTAIDRREDIPKAIESGPPADKNDEIHYLLQGNVARFNRMRQPHKDAGLIKLAGRQFIDMGEELKDKNLSGIDLWQIDAAGTCFNNVIFCEPEKERFADWRNANLRKSALLGIRAYGILAWSAQLQGAHMQGARMNWGQFLYAHFEGADLDGAWMAGADLRHAYVDERTVLISTDLVGADLRGVTGLDKLTADNLRSADLRGSFLLKEDVEKLKDTAFLKKWQGQNQNHEKLLVNTDADISELQKQEVDRIEAERQAGSGGRPDSTQNDPPGKEKLAFLTPRVSLIGAVVAGAAAFWAFVSGRKKKDEPGQEPPEEDKGRGWKIIGGLALAGGAAWLAHRAATRKGTDGLNWMERRAQNKSASMRTP